MLNRFRPWMDKAVNKAKHLKRVKPVVSGYGSSVYGYGIAAGAVVKQKLQTIKKPVLATGERHSRQIDEVAKKRLEQAVKKDEWV